MAAARSAASDLRRDVDVLKDDIAQLRSDLVEAMKDLVEAGKTGAGETRDRLEESVRSRLESLSEAAHGVAERGRRAVHTAEQYVEEKPLQSVAVAFGVGLLLGAALRK